MVYEKLLQLHNNEIIPWKFEINFYCINKRSSNLIDLIKLEISIKTVSLLRYEIKKYRWYDNENSKGRKQPLNVGK